MAKTTLLDGAETGGSGHAGKSSDTAVTALYKRFGLHGVSRIDHTTDLMWSWQRSKRVYLATSHWTDMQVLVFARKLTHVTLNQTSGDKTPSLRAGLAFARS